MDSVWRETSVPFGEIKLDRLRLLVSSPAPASSLSYTEAKPRGSGASAIVYPVSNECLTFESPSPRSIGFHCLKTSRDGRNRLGNLLWARDERVEVAIVDGDAGARLFLQKILEQSGGYRCVGSYSSGEEALREVPGVHPRIVLMEVRMAGLSGIECMRHLKGRLPGLIVVLVSELTDAATMSEAFAAGGDGYLTKPFAVAQCLATIRFSVRPDRSTALERVEAPSTGEFTPLTQREHHVMGCLAKGLLYKEIADELRLSVSVVHKLLHRVFLKLHVNNRTEAVTQWRNGCGRGAGRTQRH